MTTAAIQVDRLSKQYRIGSAEQGLSYRTLRDAITDAVGVPMRRLRRRNLQAASDIIWALREVSFEVQPGEVLGIIGRNGAGKSTLLKILARITQPTSGQVLIRGRVASLLEVGTGFHPELTGRENIYLSGAILGMTRAELRRRFDEIVAFAEVEKFVDTPVKRYSSGMYLRLAFAVAAHLEPEILIVDEVLAVGDAEFQRKCLGKMKDVAQGHRTVLFVSHNMAAIQGLCTCACLLQAGQLVVKRNVAQAVSHYLSEASVSTTDHRQYQYRHRGTLVAVDSVELLVDGSQANSVQSGQSCTIRIRYHAIEPEAIGCKLSVSILLFSDGQKLVNLWTNYHGGTTVKVQPFGVIDCTINKWPFRSHVIRLDVYTHLGPLVQDHIEECLFFSSHDGDYYHSGIITNPDQGLLFMDHEWSGYALQQS
jgi:lipopolysaccharide transport system ATP-binding protein